MSTMDESTSTSTLCWGWGGGGRQKHHVLAKVQSVLRRLTRIIAFPSPLHLNDGQLLSYIFSQINSLIKNTSTFLVRKFDVFKRRWPPYLDLCSIPVVFILTNTRIVVTDCRQYCLPRRYGWTQEEGTSWNSYGIGTNQIY